VLRFKISTTDEAIALAEAAAALDVWAFSEDWADVRIAKQDVPSVLGSLPVSLRDSHAPLIHDLDEAVVQSRQSQSGHRGRGHPFFQDYQPLSVINPWMELMSSMFTTHVRRISVGLSHEGRDIPALRVGVHPTNNDRPAGARKTIIITGGSHAREWISTSTVNYLAWSLINAYGKNREITRFLEEFDFVLVPTLNPDGYVYSWETDRLWRKNRQPTKGRQQHAQKPLQRVFPRRRPFRRRRSETLRRMGQKRDAVQQRRNRRLSGPALLLAANSLPLLVLV
jgi:extracellular matrix protein 14